MVHIRKDRVAETSTTTGTGNFSLAGAITGFRAFDDVMANGDTCYYSIEAVDGNGIPTGDWETGFGTFNDTDTLVRSTVVASSNAGAAVNFSAGTKRVYISDLAGSGPFLIEKQTTSAGNPALITSFAGLGLSKVEFVIDGTVGTDDSSMTFRYRLNGVTKTDGAYNSNGEARSSSGSTATEDGAAITTIRCTDLSANWGVGNASGEGISSRVTIHNPDSTTRYKTARCQSEYIGPTGAFIIFDGGGVYTGTDALTALQGVDFGTTASDFTGTIWVYGYPG